MKRNESHVDVGGGLEGAEPVLLLQVLLPLELHLALLGLPDLPLHRRLLPGNGPGEGDIQPG